MEWERERRQKSYDQNAKKYLYHPPVGLIVPAPLVLSNRLSFFSLSPPVAYYY